MQYLIDASVYVFRAHHSLPDDMVDGDGNPVNALYGSDAVGGVVNTVTNRIPAGAPDGGGC